jgi:hypothetical protein
MNEVAKNNEPSVRASEVGPVTPTNQAIYEAGKSMLIESVRTGREFCKFMIGTSMGAIPIYLALLKFVLPEKYVPTVGVGILALVPAVLFLVAGVIFLVGYFPQQGIASLDIPAEIERERSKTVRRRQRIGITGFTVFCVAIVAGLVITGCMLRMPKGEGDQHLEATKKGTEQSYAADAVNGAADTLRSNGGITTYNLCEMVYLTVFNVFLCVMVTRAQTCGAFEANQWRDFAKVITAALVVIMGPVLFFIFALPVVHTFPTPARPLDLLTVLFWTTPTYGFQQAWLIPAKKFRWVIAEPVVRSKPSYMWWTTALVLFVLLPALLLVWGS